MLKSFRVIKKKKSWEMWRKALSNYSVYLGSTWWNIYITATEVLKVIKLAGRVSSLFPHFSGPFQERRDQNVDKATFPGDAIAWWPRCSEPPQTGSAILASLNATGNPLNLSGWESAAGVRFIAVHNFPLCRCVFLSTRCQINIQRLRYKVAAGGGRGRV